MPPLIPEHIISLPSIDLQKNLALEQDLTNLAHVEAQFRKVCSLLDNRLNSIKSKLGQINDRITRSRQKVDTIKEVNEAITIVSPSKFVKSYKKGLDLTYHQRVDLDFLNNERIPLIDFEEKVTLNPNSELKISKENVTNLPLGKNSEELGNLLKLTKSTFKNKREMFEGDLAVQNIKFQGLGRVPRSIKYIDSLVVFNSTKNPYKKYSSFDNLVTNSQLNLPKKRIVEDKIGVNLAEAPKTLIEGDMLQQFGIQDYKFRPQMKELPQIKAPTQLGLKGIVNVNLSNVDNDSFVPSQADFMRKPTLSDPKLPNEEQTTQGMPYAYSRQGTMNLTSSQNVSSSNTQSQNTNTFAPVITQTKQPPSNPVISNNNQTVQQTNNMPPPQNLNLPPPNLKLAPPNLNLPPPNLNLPPPTNLNLPPPTNLSLPPPNVNLPQNGPVNNDLKNLPPVTNARAALLDEIRNPNNMAKLKKAKPVEKTPLERQTKGKADPKQSHMDYLKQQIQLRFAALNKGKKPTKVESSGSENDSS